MFNLLEDKELRIKGTTQKEFAHIDSLENRGNFLEMEA